MCVFPRFCMVKVIVEPVALVNASLEVFPPEGYYFKQLLVIESVLHAVYQESRVVPTTKLADASVEFVDTTIGCVLATRGMENSYDRSLKFFSEQLQRPVAGLGGEFMTEEEKYNWVQKHKKYCKGSCFL